MKKIFSLMMAVCMALCTFAIDWSGYEYLGDGAQGGALANKYKVAAAEGMNVVNIQQPGFAAEAGIYVTFPAAPITDCTVASAADGAGIVLYLSAFTAKETAVSLKANDVLYEFTVYYEDGVEAAAGPEIAFSVANVWNTDYALVASNTDTRSASGHGNKVYWCNKADKKVYSYDGTEKVEVLANDAFVNTAFAMDDAGNFVTVGPFPSVPNTMTVVSHDGQTANTVAITGLARTDQINATGDIFSAEGGYVFVYGNGANLQVYKVTNGAATEADVVLTTVEVAGVGGGNYVVAGNDTKQIALRRTNNENWVVIENGAATPIADMPNLKYTTLGGAIVTVAGHELYAYPYGEGSGSAFTPANYSSHFVVRDMTAGEFLPDFNDAANHIFSHNASAAVSANIVGVYMKATQIDENSAYLTAFNSQGMSCWLISASVSYNVTATCDATMGTVEGAGKLAAGGTATMVATPNLGYSFVNWTVNGEVVSTDATYAFTVDANVDLVANFQAEANKTLTIAATEGLGTVTLPEGLQMGENSIVYGTEIALVAVPAEGKTFLNWTNGEEVYSTDAAITVKVVEDMALTANFTSIVHLNYVIGEGAVTNDFGWTSKQDMYNDMYAAINAALGMSKVPGNLEGMELTGTGTIPSDFYSGATDQHTTIMANEDFVTKFTWLVEYMDSICTQDGKTLPSTLPAALRYNLQAFFICGQYTGWPASPNYVVAGTPEAFLAYWQHAFCNPTEVTGEFVLNTPYHPTLTFNGWYDNPEFTGDPIAVVNTETTATTLYAQWIEYIPSIAEVIAMEDNTETKVRGTVSMVVGNEFWIQDINNGIMCFQADHGVAVGEEVTLAATKVTYGGIPELKNITVEKHIAGTPVVVPVVTLTELKANDGADYMSKLVKVTGLNISEYDSYHNPTLTDGVETIKAYKVTLDETLFPLGTKVNVTLVLSAYNGTLQLRGNAENVEAVAAAGRDNHAYPTIDDVYTLSNDWLYSRVLDNFEDNKPALDQHARGLAVKNGIMYFPNRINGITDRIGNDFQLVRVDGATGRMLDPIAVSDNIFTTTDSVGNVSYAPSTIYFNDLACDGAGNLLTCNCVSANQLFQVWKIDEATGEGTLVMESRLTEDITNVPDTTVKKARLDYMGVYGDVNTHAVIMSSDQNTMYVYKWVIDNGVVTSAKGIECKVSVNDDSYMSTVTTIGTGPRVFPVDDEYFYLDGWNTLPTLFDARGNLSEDFKEAELGNMVPMGGDTILLGVGHNGVAEFQIGDEYFLVVAATNTDGSKGGATTVSAKSSFAIFKFADESKAFAEITPMWFFPYDGMGGTSNGVRTALPYVEVNGATAKIYVYTQQNGYGVYTMTGRAATAVETVTTISNNGINVTVEANDIVLSEIAGVQVYALNGMMIANTVADRINVPAGVYMVRTNNANGTSVSKVIVK